MVFHLVNQADVGEQLLSRVHMRTSPSKATKEQIEKKNSLDSPQSLHPLLSHLTFINTRPTSQR